jgi:gamma-glutamylcyclotransferase (GGCT)/AIG2-like uncharacterized protein YtfP
LHAACHGEPALFAQELRVTVLAVLDRLFVYGTLRRGERAWCQIEPYAAASELARCRGTMVAFERGYPGLALAGDTVITGELVTLCELDAALAALDAYEGDEFTRRAIDVETAAGPVRAWVYAVEDHAVMASGTPVPGGDWVVFRLGSQPAK